MGKGRAPCCDKSQVKRGPWSPSEDLKLIAFIQKFGHENWRSLPKQAGLQRCGKSCRLRWINYLRPDVKRGNFTSEEEETIIRFHKALGNKWSKIASLLPGRTDNEIKNVWNTHLKKRLAVNKSSESSADESKIESSITSSSTSSSVSFQSTDERPNLSNTVHGTSDSNEQTSHVTMTDEIGNDLEKQVSNEINDIPQEDPKGSSISQSSVESNILNSSNKIVAHKPEQQLASPLTYPGSYDVESVLQEVDKPNHLFEIPWEPYYDLWNILDNIEPFQSNEVQLGGEESVQDAEAKNEFGVGETKESKKEDQDPPKNYAVESEEDLNQAFDINDMIMPEVELDLDYIDQLWPFTWSQNNTSL